MITSFDGNLMARIRHSIGFSGRSSGIVAACILLTVASGAIHRWQRGWPSAEEIAAARKTVASLPAQLGTWELAGREPLGESAQRMLNCPAHANANYRNRRTGEFVTVTLLYGPTATLSVHTPEVCYSSENYVVADQRERIGAGEAGEHRFWRALLEPRFAAAPPLVVYYGWHDGKAWRAPDNARFYFARPRMIYKLQIAAHGTGGVSDAGQQFLGDFVPRITRRITGQESSPPQLANARP